MPNQRNIARRLEQTQVVERPGGVTGYDTFYDASTYTPTYLGGTTPGVTTYSVQQGAWTRIGNMVFATGTIAWTGATGTGAVNVSLPFASANVANQNHTGSFWQTTVTFANGTPQILISPATSFFIITSPITNGANANVNIEAAGTLVFSVAYRIV